MNSVTIIGKLQNSIDARTRIIEIIREDGDGTIKVPLKHWTKDENTLLNTLKEGAYVMIRGRIEVDEKIGIYVVSEQISIIK